MYEPEYGVVDEYVFVGIVVGWKPFAVGYSSSMVGRRLRLPYAAASFFSSDAFPAGGSACSTMVKSSP